MRSALLVFALAACSAGSSTGPAWPRSAAQESDGGQTLEPRAAARAIAAVAEEDKPAERAGDDKPAPATASAAADTDKPVTTPAAPVAPAGDELMISEEIVIEIED